MKTTIEVSDALFQSAKQLAQKNQTTMRALVEEGLRRVINEQPLPKKAAFKLADMRMHSKKMLITDPREWSEMEMTYLVENAISTATKPNKSRA